MLKFSIIIPVKEINFYIEESISHLLNLDYRSDKYEIIILPNNKPNHIPKYLRDSRIRIIPTGKVSPAVKRDIGAKKSMYGLLAFIDDDSYPKRDWLKIANKIFTKIPKRYAAINGPAVTPLDATKTERLSGAFFESRFGGGAAHRCKDVGKSFNVDDAPSVNLIVKREAFIEVGGFGSEHWPGEDSLFCQKLKDSGHKIWHQNDLIIFHHRRKTISAHLKQVAGYGKHRGNFFCKGIGCSRKFLYLVPSIFLLWNLIILFLSPGIWLISSAIYFYLLLISFTIDPHQQFSITSGLLVLFFISHLTYGLFFIKGFFTRNIRSRLR